MAFAKYLSSGDVITAADWNTYVVDTHNRLVTQAIAAPESVGAHAPSLLTIAAVGAAASVSQKPISRRALLGLGRFSK